jgi:hypothetical protein
MLPRGGARRRADINQRDRVITLDSRLILEIGQRRARTAENRDKLIEFPRILISKKRLEKKKDGKQTKQTNKNK